MKTISFFAFTSLLSACTAYTPINKLTLPAPSVISGQVSTVEDTETFTLKDETGQIEVEWEGEDLTPALSVGEEVTVSGVVDEDESIGEDRIHAEEFDAYCIKRADGTVVKALIHCDL